MANMEQQRTHWAASFDAVEQEIFTLFYTRQTWRVLRAVFVDGGTKNRGTAVSYLDRTYVAAICSAIRRQLKVEQRANSLTRSLLQVRDNPQLMDRARFVALFHGGHEPDPYFSADAAFDKYAKAGSDTIDPATIDDALGKLSAASRPVEKYADRVIAHSDRRSANLAFGEIDQSLMILEATVKQFWSFVHPGVMLHSPTPVMDLNFLRMFQSPLIDSSFIPPLHE